MYNYISALAHTFIDSLPSTGIKFFARSAVDKEPRTRRVVHWSSARPHPFPGLAVRSVLNYSNGRYGAHYFTGGWLVGWMDVRSIRANFQLDICACR